MGSSAFRTLAYSLLSASCWSYSKVCLDLHEANNSWRIVLHLSLTSFWKHQMLYHWQFLHLGLRQTVEEYLWFLRHNQEVSDCARQWNYLVQLRSKARQVDHPMKLKVVAQISVLCWQRLESPSLFPRKLDFNQYQNPTQTEIASSHPEAWGLHSTR